MADSRHPRRWRLGVGSTHRDDLPFSRAAVPNNRDTTRDVSQITAAVAAR
ncbi:hypothetical protein [Halobellus rufus]|nr:hypothetical protein [Halobellus rufus]